MFATRTRPPSCQHDEVGVCMGDHGRVGVMTSYMFITNDQHAYISGQRTVRQLGGWNGLVRCVSLQKLYPFPGVNNS